MIGATFDPATQGALLAIGWQIDFRETAPAWPGNAMAFGQALRQGGVVYHKYQAQSNTTRQTYPAAGLTAADFVPYGDTSHPDFSLAGGPIEFGFFTANANSSTYAGYINEAGFDNWSMTLEFDATVPVNEETWGAIKSLYRQCEPREPAPLRSAPSGGDCSLYRDVSSDVSRKARSEVIESESR